MDVGGEGSGLCGPAVLGDGEKDEAGEKLQARFFEAGLHRRDSKERNKLCKEELHGLVLG